MLRVGKMGSWRQTGHSSYVLRLGETRGVFATTDTSVATNRPRSSTEGLLGPLSGLGFATTDEDGRFQIEFTEAAFRDWRESSPEVYLRVFDRDGTNELLHTRDRPRPR